MNVIKEFFKLYNLSDKTVEKIKDITEYLCIFPYLPLVKIDYMRRKERRTSYYAVFDRYHRFGPNLGIVDLLENLHFIINFKNDIKVLSGTNTEIKYKLYMLNKEIREEICENVINEKLRNFEKELEEQNLLDVSFIMKEILMRKSGGPYKTHLIPAYEIDFTNIVNPYIYIEKKINKYFNKDEMFLQFLLNIALNKKVQEFIKLMIKNKLAIYSAESYTAQYVDYGPKLYIPEVTKNFIINYNYKNINLEKIIYENLPWLAVYNLIILYYIPYFNFIKFSKKYITTEHLPELIDEMKKIIDVLRTRIEISDLVAIEDDSTPKLLIAENKELMISVLSQYINNYLLK